MATESPLFQSSMELLGHSFSHFAGTTELDRKLVILHLANSVELLLKDMLLDIGQTIYRNPKETVTIYGCISCLSENKIDIPYLNKLELLIDERNSIQHEGSVDTSLREWAVELLNQNSPTPFSTETRQRLTTGEISFSPALQTLLASPEYQGSSIVVSPDGTRLIIGSRDGSIRIHDIQTGALITVFRGHEDAISALAVFPDGRNLASASFDGTIRIWRLVDGNELARFNFEDSVTGIAISPDGASLFGRTQLGDVLQFDAQTGQLIMQLTLPQ